MRAARLDGDERSRRGRGGEGRRVAVTDTTAALTRDEVEEAMRDVVDPELGINVVDLGLIYDVFIEPETDPGAAPVVTLDMTLTSAACPLTDVIEDQASAALTGVRRQDQLGLATAVGARQDHRRRSRATTRARLQRLNADREYRPPPVG